VLASNYIIIRYPVTFGRDSPWPCRLWPWLQVWSERGCLSSWEAWQSPLCRNISSLRNKLCNVRWATVTVRSPNVVLYRVSEHPLVWAARWRCCRL